MHRNASILVCGVVGAAACGLALLGDRLRHVERGTDTSEHIAESETPAVVATLPRLAREQPQRTQALETGRIAPSTPEPRTEASQSYSDSSSTAKLEGRWREESADPGWTDSVEQYVLDALDAVKVPSDSLGEVSCKQTICKLTFLFDEADQAVKLHELRNPDLDLTYSRSGDEYEVFVERK